METVSEEETLLNAPLGSSGSVGDGLDESIANVVGAASVDLLRTCDVHDTLVKLLLDHLIVGESLFTDSQFSFDVGVSLASGALKFVILALEAVHLRSESLILNFDLLDEDQVILIEMAHSSDFIVTRSHIQLQLSKLLIAIFLKRSEFKQNFLVALALLTEVCLQLADPSFLLVLSLSEEADLSIVDIDQILFSQCHLFGLTVLQLLDLLGVLRFKLALDIIVGSKHTLHILLSLLFGIKKAQLSAVNLVLQSLRLFLQVGALTAQESLVLVEKINFASQTLISSLDFTFGLLQSRVLKISLALFRDHDAVVVLKLTQFLILLLQFVAALSQLFILSRDLLMISFKVSVASVQSSYCSFAVILDVLELRTGSIDLNAQFFNFVMG